MAGDTEVAITGRGAVSPLGTGVDVLLDGMWHNSLGIRTAPWARDPENPFTWWAVVPDFRPGDWMDAMVEAGTDLFAQYALAAAAQAVADAGFTELDGERTAVVHGTSMGGTRALMRAQHDYERGGTRAVERKTMIQIFPNMAAAQIAMRWGLHGPQLTVCTACASSADAIGLGAEMIRSGRADVAIVGGTEGGLPLASGDADGDFVPAMYIGQAAYGMTTAQRDPRKASMPFDVNRSGIVSGEGSAALVLESAAHARARGATVHGLISGYASLADSYHPSSPTPDGRWEAKAMHGALSSAAVVPDQVDALIAHATATPKGDEAEINAINQVHGERGAPLMVTSLKGHIGHTGAASAAMGVIVGMEAMRVGTLPNVGCTRDVEPSVRFEVVLDAPAPVELDVLQVNAFGFGGQNTSLVIVRTDS
ncbi:MAG TPA: beta-ketoacyl-[acyl-carrier-protein] synthase family protein [Pseudonocardia sp.]|nr:beta-ketoacyl-[acyl-carrier-protein] synthase family protein [Pseudonocardia sp.]